MGRSLCRSAGTRPSVIAMYGGTKGSMSGNIRHTRIDYRNPIQSMDYELC